jgi:hypothetical protein
MNTFDPVAHDRWLASACSWLSLAIFLSVLTNLVVGWIDISGRSSGGDAGFVVLGDFIRLVFLTTPIGIVACLPFSIVASTRLRRGTVLLTVQLIALALLGAHFVLSI